MGKAIELYKQDGTSAGAFYCPECRVIFPDREHADNCHGERICACGEKIDRQFYAKCSTCDQKEWKAKAAAKERERFEAAVKISASNYKGGMIFGPDDQFYTEIEDCIDQYIEGQEPEYVWACMDVGVIKATTDSLYENMLENMWEDADVNDLNGVEELEAAVDAFNKANESISVWQPDYSTAILIPAAPPLTGTTQAAMGCAEEAL